MQDLLLKNITIYKGSNPKICDIYISDGVFKEIAFLGGSKQIFGPNNQAKIIDCSELIGLTPFCDLHTHIRQPGQSIKETFESGAEAAALGGFSHIFSMPNTTPPIDNLKTASWFINKAKNFDIKIIPNGAITKGLQNKRLADIEEMASLGIKIFSDDGFCVDNAFLMQNALKLAAKHNLIIAQHSQSLDIAANAQIDASIAKKFGLKAWDISAEAAIIARDAVLAAETGGHLHICHISTARSIDVIKACKDMGWPISCEVTPHHLFLTTDIFKSLDGQDDLNTKYKVNPPLRDSDNANILQDAAKEGIIDIIATDHAPHAAEDKNCGWNSAAFGMTGLETSLSVIAEVFDNDWHFIEKIMSSAPRQIAYLPVSTITHGAKADIVLIDPNANISYKAESFKSLGKNTPFDNICFKSAVKYLILDGKVQF